MEFFDTNILVYQFDQSDLAKQKLSQELFTKSIRAEKAIISTQVVQEFMNVALNKFSSKLTQDQLEEFMAQTLKHLCRHSPDFSYYARALDLYKLNSLSFYDALIVQAALDLKCKTLYSEDLQDGQKFGQLTIINPFN